MVSAADLRVPELETERLLIRELRPDDLAAVHALLDTELGEGRSLAERQRWLEWTVLAYAELHLLRQPPYADRGIQLRSSGELIGACGYAPALAPFHQVPGLQRGALSGYAPEVGLYWAVAPAHQRRGYASEAARALLGYAFGALWLGRVVAMTTYDNTASIGVMRKLGMRVERNAQPEPGWLQVVGVLENTS